MNAHTPGPWEAIEHPKDWVIKQRVTTLSETRFPVLIARVERAVNARLIAAAPDLLRELQQFVDRWSKYPNPPTGDDLRVYLDSARAAIARAEGRP